MINWLKRKKLDVFNTHPVYSVQACYHKGGRRDFGIVF